MTGNNKKLLKTLGLVFAIAACLLFLSNMFIEARQSDRQQQSLSELTYYRDFSLRYFDRASAAPSEKNFTAETARDYRVTVYNGWGPWCSACVKEMPDLQLLAEEYEPKGLLVVGVVAGYASSPSSNSDEQISAVLESLDITYPILSGDKLFADTVEPTMNNAYPGTWAVDSDGNLIDFVSGSRSIDQWRTLFDKWLEEN